MHIVKHIAKVQKAVNTLADQAKIKTDEGELLNDLLMTIKESGEMERALVDWDAKADNDKTWANAKNYFSKEYGSRNKHAAIDAKQAGYGASANQALEDEIEEAEQALAAQIVQQIQGSKSNDQSDNLQKMMEQQSKMLESNQKLMMQLMTAMMNKDNNQSRKVTFAEGTGGGGTGSTSEYGKLKVGDKKWEP